MILLYLESFGNPKKFSEIARRVGRTKPIVAVKAGRSHAGSRAAASHTGALASSDAVVDALFRQAGVIRTERLEELFDVAALLSHQPVPRGPRVAILTNAGGPGILAADACEANGLELPALGEATRAELRVVPAGGGERRQSRRHAGVGAAGTLPPRPRGDPRATTQVDSVIDDLHSAAGDGSRRRRRRHRRAARAAPTASRCSACSCAPTARRPRWRRFRRYAFPESAALALARVTTYGRWRPEAGRTGRRRSTAFNRDEIRRVVDAGAGAWRRLGDAGRGRRTARRGRDRRRAGRASRRRRSARSQAAATIGYPVALKALGPTLLHKTERRAVCLNLADDAAVRAALRRLREPVRRGDDRRCSSSRWCRRASR